MSNIIHMDTETVRAASARLVRTAEEMDIAYRTLSDRLKGIPWQGPSRDGYLNDVKGMVTRALAIAAEGEELGLRVRHEIEEWIDTDEGGAADIAGMGNGKSSWRNNDFFDPFRDMHGLIHPYTLPEGLDYLNDTEAGRQLIEDAYKAGICFKLMPEGTLIGDPNGKVVEISIADGKGYGGYQEGDKIVISDAWLERHQGSDDLARTMAHEMQHAIDEQNGVKPGYEGVEQYMNDPEQLESFLEHRTADRVASEVRAYQRGDAVRSDAAYHDDGVTSAAEARDILVTRDYESIYEQQLNEGLEGQYTVDVWTDAQGNIQVDLTPVPQLGPITAYA